MWVIPKHEVVYLFPQLLTGWIAINLGVAYQPALLPRAPCVQTDGHPVVLHVYPSGQDRSTIWYFPSGVKLRTFSEALSPQLCSYLLFPGLAQHRIDPRLKQRRVTLGSQKLSHNLLPALPANR